MELQQVQSHRKVFGYQTIFTRIGYGSFVEQNAENHNRERKINRTTDSTRQMLKGSEPTRKRDE